MDHYSKKLIEAVYSRLPISLQNLAFTLYGYKKMRERYGPHFQKCLDFLRSSEWWTSSEIESYQNEQIKKIITIAYNDVPYYRDIFQLYGIQPQDIGSIEDLNKLPILTKSVVKESARFFINTNINPKRMLTSLTSGTTGSPLKIVLTREALQFQWAIWWRHRARFGLVPGDSFLMFGARLPVINQTKPPFWRTNHAINQTYLSTYHVSPEYLSEIVGWLNAQQFKFYTGYPSAMYALAILIKEQKLELTQPPEYIVTGADALLPEFEKIIHAVFKAPVTEQYGMAEACGNLAKCEAGRFHLDFEFCGVELVPVEGLENTNIRRLIFTGFANPAMPLIRYDIGDYGYICHEPCPCGRASLSIKSIDGRVEDFIRTPDGRLIMGMNQVFEWASGISETQIVQNKIDEIEIRMVPNNEFSYEDDIMALESELRKRLGNDMKFAFQIVKSIPRTKNGKFRAVVSNLPAETQAEKELKQSLSSGIFN